MICWFEMCNHESASRKNQISGLLTSYPHLKHVHGFKGKSQLETEKDLRLPVTTIMTKVHEQFDLIGMSSVYSRTHYLVNLHQSQSRHSLRLQLIVNRIMIIKPCWEKLVRSCPAIIRTRQVYDKEGPTWCDQIKYSRQLRVRWRHSLTYLDHQSLSTVTIPLLRHP